MVSGSPPPASLTLYFTSPGVHAASWLLGAPSLPTSPCTPTQHRADSSLCQPALAGCLALCLLLFGCATPPTEHKPTPAWAGRPIGPPPSPNPGLKQLMISRAKQEWEFFGKQTVILRGSEESIPHVGAWEDDGFPYSTRVNAYWSAAGKPRLDGMDCQQPWSAAFVTWIMQGAGVPEDQFPPATAHWIYLSRLIDQSDYPGRWFVPRRVEDYSPNPGDLVCAARGPYRPASFNGYTSSEDLRGAHTHCDLVVAKEGQTLEVIGGNVRNSVSRSTLELNAQGHLQPVPRRPWFVILQNRL
jgi:hypothetical protein